MPKNIFVIVEEVDEEEFKNYSLKKKKIYEWYKYSNEFIKRVDEL